MVKNKQGPIYMNLHYLIIYTYIYIYKAYMQSLYDHGLYTFDIYIIYTLYTHVARLTWRTRFTCVCHCMYVCCIPCRHPISIDQKSNSVFKIYLRPNHEEKTCIRFRSRWFSTRLYHMIRFYLFRVGPDLGFLAGYPTGLSGMPCRKLRLFLSDTSKKGKQMGPRCRKQ